MNPREEDLRGRRLAHYMVDELEKIAQEGPPQQTSPEQQVGGELQDGVQNDAGGGEASPAHGIVASRIEQLDPKTARGIPVLQPPPGFIYSPELVAFVPDENDPGWMAAQQAVEAARNKGWYDQGQEDVQTQQAQQEVDTQAQQQVDQVAAEEGQAQQQQMMAMQQQEQEGQAMAKEKAKATMGGLRSPEGIVGAKPKPKAKPAAKKKKPAEEKPESGKGVTIKIGK
jgi:hypothetical protein